MFKVNNKNTRPTPMTSNPPLESPESATKSVLQKSVLKNFAKFTGKHLCWNLFFASGLQLH